MDKATLIGLIVGLGGTLGGYMVEGGHLSALWGLPSFLIVVGATVGAVAISMSFEELKQIPSLVKLVLMESKLEYDSLIAKISELAAVARKDGILALEPMISQLDNRFLASGILMVVDGMDKDACKSIMEYEINAVSERHTRRAKIFELAGGFCPTMGIMGTVMSMISIMGELDKPDTLGPKIGMAFTATLYGVLLANLFFFPMSEKLKGRSHCELISMEMCMEGVLSIQAGESPKIIEEKLAVFVNLKRKSEEAKNGAKE